MKRAFTESEQKALDEMSPTLNGDLIIKDWWQDNNEKYYYSNLYITFHRACTNACDFCRNYELEYIENKSDFDAKVKALKAWLPSIRSISYGGGDPILFIDALKRFRTKVPHDRSETIITSGIAGEFFKHKTFIGDFTKEPYKNNFLAISRHHIDDQINHEIFGGKNELLSWKDLVKVSKEMLNSPLLLKCTCRKGGIDSADAITEYANKARRDLNANVTFNDLDPVLTSPGQYAEKQISDDVFTEAIQKLVASGYEDIRNDWGRTSTGFDIGTVVNYDTTYQLHNGNKIYDQVNFLRYHKTHEEAQTAWDKAKLREFNFSMMPNGEFFTDERNTQRMIP